MSKKGRFLIRSTLTTLVLCGVLITAVLSHAMSAMAASGQCYTTQGVYYFNEPIFVIVRTYTGINNTRLIIYLQNYGQVNTITIGKVGIGEWQFRIGVAGPPEGGRTLILADGETTLSSASYFVMGPLTPPPPSPSSSPSTTTIQTTISYQTLTSYVTVPITVSEQITTTATTTLPPPMDVDYIMLAIIIVLIVLVISLLAIFSARRRT